jgi:hypothetical protein
MDFVDDVLRALDAFLVEVGRHPVRVVLPRPLAIGQLAQIVQQAPPQQCRVAHRIEGQCALDELVDRIEFAILADEFADAFGAVNSGPTSTSIRPDIEAAWRIA